MILRFWLGFFRFGLFTSWIPAAIAAGGAILGSLIGSRSQRAANEENIAMQREFAQNGIRWKVEDAKAAGLHPLFALGGSGATFSPSSQPVMDGQNISRAAQAFASGLETEMSQAQLDAVRAGAQKDRALAAAADAETALRRQGALASAPVAESFPVVMPGQSVRGLTVEEQLPGGGYSALDQGLPLAPLPKVPPYLGSLEASPGFKVYAVPGLGEVILPSASSMSEALESLENPVLQAAVAAANAVHYGKAGEARLYKLTGKQVWTDPIGWGVDKLREKARPYIREQR